MSTREQASRVWINISSRGKYAGDILFTTCVCYEHVVMFNVIIFSTHRQKSAVQSILSG